MALKAFKLERYFAQYEFKVKYLLSASDCESLTMQELLEMASPESIALWQELKLGYTESQGHPLLRAEAARLYQKIGAENVVTAAPEEAIFIAMHTLVKRGDHVVVVTPTYQSLYEIAHSIGCRIIPWRLEPGPAGWQPDLEQLERIVTPRTRLMVLNFPNNPTGWLPTQNELEIIIDFARKHDLTIFSDEMYRLLESSPALLLPPVCDIYEKGISLSGLSKSFALPGLRIGWLAAQEKALIDRWLTYKDYTTICSSAPGEILGIIALQNKEKILQRNNKIIRSNTTIAKRFFHEYQEQFAWIPPKAGSVAFPQLLGKKPVEQFCQEVLEQQGVMIVPGSMFEVKGNYFRIGLGRKNFGEALSHVSDHLTTAS
jgi:aspartate/methionine/tyrosine aminotransferase